jgi:methylenetetrahydrofolate dehydrogenase (NADP+) / methenyltetrahydrofolate cyclohydrolase
MNVDGKQIAAAIAEAVAAEIQTAKLEPTLVVLTCAPNFETRKYLDLKKRKAEALGIALVVDELPETSTTLEVLTALAAAVVTADGVIVQLPLPAQIDTAAVLGAIPVTHDVDAFSYAGEAGAVLPPVVGAIAEIAERHGVVWAGKRVTVFGEGRLVGAPGAAYARSLGAEVVVLTIASTPSEVAAATASADIIILGVGKPNLLLPEMVKPGVVIFDAGASEDGGLLVGDASPTVAEVASVFTPVPGGIGPITIALLYRNLLELKARQ